MSSTTLRRARAGAIAALVLGTLVPLGTTPTALAATINSATITGGAGSATVGGNVYAKQGAPLTLTVTTDGSTRCVELSPAVATIQSSNAQKTSWVFNWNAGSGDGPQGLTVTASNGVTGGSTPSCTGSGRVSAPTSYVLDNTPPAVSSTITPAANAAGWRNANISIEWAATDTGSGVASGPTPLMSNQSSNTPGATFTSSSTDRVGNVGSGAATVKLDKGAPTITASPFPGPNGFGWNNTDVTVSFICSDEFSGIKFCSPTTVRSANGENQVVSGTATDNADNTNSASATVSIDKVAPTLAGAPTTAHNGAGWYNNDVTIAWVATDTGGSGVAAVPVNSIITGEGAAQTATTTVSDKAGNVTPATSAPVKIDKTSPVTSAVAPSDWNNRAVTVQLSARDGLSGVASTHYQLDENSPQAGTNVMISTDGIHSLSFWSVDVAGNIEAAKTVSVKIDQTPPTINHTQSPLPNDNGWNNTTVQISFVCDDIAGSGIQSCGPNRTADTEGENQSFEGIAVDFAGNQTNDPATVSIDLTAPSVFASADRAPNAATWYSAPVAVSFVTTDALSGVDVAAPSVVLGEGVDQMASGTSIDNAGNTGTASLSGINIDLTPPQLDGLASSTAWVDHDVAVTWSCSDALSGLAGPCPASSVITGEGTDLATSESVADNAGNTTNTTVRGIRIDRTAPSTLVSVPDPLPSGWYAGPVEVTLTTGPDLSGVAATFYRVDDGDVQEYSGPFNHDLRGEHIVTFWSVDIAGNVEDATIAGHSITIKIDGNPPTIDGYRSPAANEFGWNNGPVYVGFSCSDAESGLAYCDPGLDLTNEDMDQGYTGTAQDFAGNKALASIGGINIDLTAPTLSGEAEESPNAAGWYRDDVTVTWTGFDNLSGIDPSTQPAPSVISGEGVLNAGPVTISDKAGNTSLAASYGPVQIDRTPPTITGAPTSTPNDAGWYRNAVTVTFICADQQLADGNPGSGVANCSDPRVINTDGASRSVTSAQPDDRAGNRGTAATVSGISIDSQAPATTAVELCTGNNIYCRGTSASVTLTAVDQAGLSGVKEIHYQVNGGAPITYVGSSTTVDVPLGDESGTAMLEFWAVDNAGNPESKGGVSLQYDNLAPVVSHAVTPTPNANGWNRSTTSIEFSAVDDLGGSGIDVTTWVGQHASVTAETEGTTIGASVEDIAGNVGTDSVWVRLDATAPSIAGAPTTSANANGWYRSSVTIEWSCDDVGPVQSGVAACPSTDTFLLEGSDLERMGRATDAADNIGSAIAGGINIDSTPPTITLIGLQNRYELGQDTGLTCTASDNLSGIDATGCVVRITGGNTNGVGAFVATAVATDLAGNRTEITRNFNVIYRWTGFSQPINDTAHQVDQNTSVFKGNSTVPAKFQLRNASGQVVQALTAPIWLTPVKGGATTSAVDENQYSEPPMSGLAFKWDATSQQYHYNWSTKGSSIGFFYRIGVRLDDGQTYYVNIGLR